jgi:hypothetical protein
VKTRISLLLTSLLLANAPLKADYDLSSGGTALIEENKRPYGLNLEMEGEWIGRSDFYKKRFGKNKIQYRDINADAEATLYYDECYGEAILFGVGYEYTRLDWGNNPFFHQKTYNTANTHLTFVTCRLPDWKLFASATYNIDADTWNFSHYSTWDLLTFGRYQYCYNVGITLGIYAETGMKLDRVYPVIGFDWTINDCLKLNAVFPFNMSLEYRWSDCWSAFIGGRCFSDRHRIAHGHGRWEHAVWRYSNSGVEAGLKFNQDCWMTSEVHAGYTLGGRIKVADKHSHHSHNFGFKPAPYFGASAAVHF